MNLNKIAIIVYYATVCIFILAFSFVVPFQQAEEARVTYTNMLFSEYKKANNLVYVDETNEAVKQIRRSGHDFGKTKYKELSGKFGLITCVVVLLLTLLLPFTRLSDLIWIGGGFSALYGLGALNTESFVIIMLLVLIAYKLKKWRIKSVQKGSR